MTPYRLSSQSEFAEALAHSLAAKFEAGSPISIQIAVAEERAMKANMSLALGQVKLHPSAPSPEEGWERSLQDAIRYGSFSWAVPKYDHLVAELEACIQEDIKAEAVRNRLRECIKAIGLAAFRCGLAHPVLDAGFVTCLPFREPIAVIADTNAVLQGGLDFIVRFLSPRASIKVPAVCHMEILNWSDNYFALRRAEKIRPTKTILEHTRSQGAQRALLRLSNRSDIDIERLRLGQDPLRGFITDLPDPEDKALNLHQVQRSFADRLILETAIAQQRETAVSNREVFVLTADQGLARMALGEGLEVIYFQANSAFNVFGRTLTGTPFLPFSNRDTASPYYSVDLCSLLWELAVTFGKASLDFGAGAFELCAISENLHWQPYHAKDDLLWTTTRELDSAATSVSVAVRKPNPAPKVRISSSTSVAEQGRKLLGVYRVAPDPLLKLIGALHAQGRVSISRAAELSGIGSEKFFGEYKNFVLAGGLARQDGTNLIATDSLSRLWSALLSLDLFSIEAGLRGVPSFDDFCATLQERFPLAVQSVDNMNARGFRSYVTLAELAGAALNIPGEGAYATSNHPDAATFANMAIEGYNATRRGEAYSLTGDWLETLARRFGVHPTEAKRKLAEARNEKLLERYTEGATPETRYGSHNLSVLEIEKGLPAIRRINLYSGEFLIQGRASVGIRIEDLR